MTIGTSGIASIPAEQNTDAARADVDAECPIPYLPCARYAKGQEHCASTFKEGREMGEGKGHAGRVMRRLIAAVAVTDVAYRLFMREPLRRALPLAF